MARLHLSLQFFGGPDPVPEPTPAPTPAPEPTPTPDPESLAQITQRYQAEIAAKDKQIKDLQETIGVLCGGKPAPTPGDPAPKDGRHISPSLRALLR